MNRIWLLTSALLALGLGCSAPAEPDTEEVPRIIVDEEAGLDDDRATSNDDDPDDDDSTPDDGDPDPEDEEPEDVKPRDDVQWPEFSGTPCAVNAQSGVCLPTASCGGTSTPGHCPGPADMQCCVAACEGGLCGAEQTCGDWAPSDSCAGPTGVGCCLPTDDDGAPLGGLWPTYYYLAQEADHGGADTTTLFDSQCQAIAQVPDSFSDSACIEGSGRLEDGRVVNYDSTCNCGRPCPTGGTVCYVDLNPQAFPWGMGAFGNALQPLRSIAVDRNRIPLRTVVYVSEFDGVEIPAVDGIGGFVHDGCFRADDVGGAIDGPHIDIFSGTRGMWRALEPIIPTRANLTGFANASKCSYLAL